MFPGVLNKTLYALDNLPNSWKTNYKRATQSDALSTSLVTGIVPCYDDWSQTILGTEPSLAQISKLGRDHVARYIPNTNINHIRELEEIAKAKALIPGDDRAIKRAEALGKLDCSWLGCSTPPKGPFERVKAHRCSACKEVKYCCAACQKADWPGHKKACKLIKERRNS